MGQLWLQVGAALFDIPNVTTFSGGTEATAFNPRAVAAMRRAGFEIKQMDESSNPLYQVSIGTQLPRMELFSKAYHHEANPQKAFAAIMVCTDADEKCPIVLGADGRFAIPFEDPKAFDGTDREAQAYDERCRQIGREMLYVMYTVNDQRLGG